MIKPLAPASLVAGTGHAPPASVFHILWLALLARTLSPAQTR